MVRDGDHARSCAFGTRAVAAPLESQSVRTGQGVITGVMFTGPRRRLGGRDRFGGWPSSCCDRGRRLALNPRLKENVMADISRRRMRSARVAIGVTAVVAASLSE